LATTDLSSGLGAKVCSTFSHFNWANTGVASAKKRERITLAILLLGLRKTSRQDAKTQRFSLEVINDRVDIVLEDCLI
jgi:hypothetical protein